MTLQEHAKIAGKLGKQMWEEFNKHELTLGDVMIIVSVMADHTIRMVCQMCNEDYHETLEFFCDTLLKNADFNELKEELKR